MLHFIDFEVFEYDWLCVIVNPLNNEETVIVNDEEKLQNYYEKYKKEIFVGYNIRQYDQFIMKAILLGLNPKRVNDKIIKENKKGFEISNLFNKIPLLFYDVMTSMHSLKTLEAFMGHNIHETTVDFELNRKLTDAEIQETIKYCKNDVYETINVFVKRFEEFQAVTSLITAFNMPLSYISKTKAQLSAIILNCTKVERNDEWDLYTLDTIKLNKYHYIKDWFLNKDNQDYEKSLEVIIAGIEHKFAWGGLHGAIPMYHSKGNIYHVDVESFYPAIMIEYNLLSRNVANPAKYKEIRDKRIVFKREKNPLEKPYKIVLNGTYGICKDKYSAAYDPRNANLVCINGQLLLLDLIEKMEKIKGFKLIQSNTDGLIIEIGDGQYDKLKEVCNEWQTRTRMGLAFDEIDEIWQKDVNNYIFRFKDGKYERKGSWVKKNTELDNDMPILNTAIVKALTENIPVNITINNCTDLTQFQKIVKVSSKYKNGWHNGAVLNDKTYRVYASKDVNDTYIGKQKSDGATIEKFANTPENCFIINTDINGLDIPEKLDRQWYIREANDRLAAFVKVA
jgi:DNA polymerase elongation subunit (family B)